MLYYRYDNSFEGLLTCVFEAFNRKEFPHRILDDEENLPLFSDELSVVTDPDKSERVLNGLKKKISASAMKMLFICFLSEDSEVDMMIFRYIKKTFESDRSIELNFADPDVLDLSRIYKKVTREEEKMRQFVRFQKTKDGIYFAYVEPRYNVLPLVAEFFEDRYADQQWVIYDAARKYGLYYDLNKTEEVRFENLEVMSNGRLTEEQMNNEELDFQELWKNYLKSITIRERMNLKLQRQHMPRRFWKYLTEKQ